jgi:hypothetical protein
MTDINALLNRIDQEIAAEVGRHKTGWAELRNPPGFRRSTFRAAAKGSSR